MRFVRTAGLWTTGPAVPAGPTSAVLELSGAVLAWTVDDQTATVTMTLTDVTAAEWLWRVVGEDGHVALVAALDAAEGDAPVDVPTVHAAADALAPLRRLAFGHWLRRWWPASARDGIVALDPAVLDGEVALLTVAAQDYFADDTFDSDVSDLLAQHLPALTALVHRGDPRAGELASACLELADDVGVGGGGVFVEASPDGLRDDYALAAGTTPGRRSAEAIASGVGSVDWTAVPPGVFDAADGTVDWSIEVSGTAPVATVRVAASADVDGIEIRLNSGAHAAAGVLTADGRATLEIASMTEDQAWDHDWSATTVSVGADVTADEDAAGTRDRVRDFARARLDAHRPDGRPAAGVDAYLAEVLAAESDY